MNTTTRHNCNVLGVRSGFRFAVTGLAAVLATTVTAEESHWVSGAACEAINSNYSAQSLGGFGAVANKSTTASLQVGCPIAPDHFNYNYIEVTISATKKTNATMSCAVFSRDFGNTAGVVKTRSSSATGNVSFNMPDIDIQTWLFHTIRCDIPKAGGSGGNTRSLVNGYNYREYN